MMKVGALKTLNHLLKKLTTTFKKILGLVSIFKNRKLILKYIDGGTEINEDMLKTCFEISLLIDKNGKPHTIAETLIQPAISSFIRKVSKLDDARMTQLPLTTI